MKQTPKVFALLITLSLISACGIIINNERFDSAKWKSGNARVKGKMVYDLQTGKILLGKSKTEVAELLYKPDIAEKLKTSQTSDDWVFDIDTNVPVDIYFAIHFDKDSQKVKSTDIGD